MEIQTNEKVLAMYRAIGEYIGEGVDISCLKVSDITARAGIGKGTAYEYFRSKDELVECALNYHFMMRYQALDEATENQETLREATGKCFEWIEKNFGSREILWQCARAFQSREILREPAEDKNRMEESMNRVAELFSGILQKLVRAGKKEGAIPEDFPDLMAQLALFSPLFGYYTYLGFREKRDAEEERRVREFMYQCMLRSFETPETAGEENYGQNL